MTKRLYDNIDIDLKNNIDILKKRKTEEVAEILKQLIKEINSLISNKKYVIKDIEKEYDLIKIKIDTWLNSNITELPLYYKTCNIKKMDIIMNEIILYYKDQGHKLEWEYTNYIFTSYVPGCPTTVMYKDGIKVCKIIN